jgi:hypothetical protein
LDYSSAFSQRRILATRSSVDFIYLNFKKDLLFIILLLYSNHNDTGSTRDELQQPHKAMELYKSLQVLNALFNEAMSPLAIPIVKLVWFLFEM